MGGGGRKAGGRVEKELAGDDVYVGRGGGGIVLRSVQGRTGGSRGLWFTSPSEDITTTRGYYHLRASHEEAEEAPPEDTTT